MTRLLEQRIAALCAVLVLAGPGHAQDPDAVVAELRARAHPIASLDPGAPDADLAFLDELVRGKRVVLLGEELHGVREFSLLKHRMIRYLVEHHGFDTIAWEQDTLRCAEIDRYLNTGDGDPRGLLAGTYWCWNTQAIAGLLEGLRKHVVDAGRPLHLVGVDNQGTTLAARELRAVAEELALGDLEPVLAPFALGRTAYQALPQPERETHRAALDRLEAQLAAARDANEVESARWTRATRARAAARILTEVHELWTAPHARARMNARDRHMGERTLELLEDPDRKVIVWAHNAHASRAIFYGGVEPLGLHVSQAAPALVVGLYFGCGEWLLDPRAREDADTQRLEHVVPGSLGATLTDVRDGAWAADVRSPSATSALRGFLDAPPPGHFDDFTDEPPALTGAIDVLVFVDRVTAARAN